MIPNDKRLDALRLLPKLRTRGEPWSDDQDIIRLSLQAACDLLGAAAGCVARLPFGETVPDILCQVPQRYLWDTSALEASIRNAPSQIRPDYLIAPVLRLGRQWAFLCLHEAQRRFTRDDSEALQLVADNMSALLGQADNDRIVDVCDRLDGKTIEQPTLAHLAGHILDLLGNLTHHNHSSAFLIATDNGTSLEFVAERMVATGTSSGRVGTRVPLSAALHTRLRDEASCGFTRVENQWHDWFGNGTELASLLQLPAPTDASHALPDETSILCGSLVARDELIGLIKVAAGRPRALGEYEADLLRQLAPHLTLVLKYARLVGSLQHRIVEAERKHHAADLARAVSHDVNNALGAVLPLVQQIGADLRAGELDLAVMAEDLQQIESTLQVCRRIFGNMLSFARHGRKVDSADVRLATEVTTGMLRGSFERAGITIELRIHDDLPRIRSGQGDLEQLLLNLMTNAREAMPEGGTLRLVADPCQEMVEIAIEDSGGGVPPELLDRIEEPFFTTKANSTGLGLSICRSIVFNLGGQLQIESTLGKGTIARIRLPVAPSEAVGAAP